MKHSLFTQSYKGLYIHSHCNGENSIVQCTMPFKNLRGKSVENMKRRIRNEIKRTMEFVTEESFLRLPNDLNGNPRYYLSSQDTTEKLAREAGGTMYRGNRYGAGWVFSTYNLRGTVTTLNA